MNRLQNEQWQSTKHISNIASSKEIKEQASREVMNEHTIAMLLIFFLLLPLPMPRVATKNHQRDEQEKFKQNGHFNNFNFDLYISFTSIISS